MYRHARCSRLVRGGAVTTLPAGTMSFRNRLTLFFVLIVVVPMVAVAFVLFGLISNNEQGKAEARAGQRQGVARNLALTEIRERTLRVAVAVAARRAAGRRAARRRRDGDPRPRRGAAQERARRAHRPARAARAPWPTSARPTRRCRSRGAWCPATAARTSRGCRSRSCGRTTYAQRVRSLTGAGRRRAPRQRDPAATTVPNVDPQDLPADAGRARGRRTGVPRGVVQRARLPGPAAARDGAAAQGGRDDRRRAQPPARRRHPARLLHPGLHLRGDGVALPAAPDPGVPGRGAPPGQRRLHGHRADHRARRVRRAGRRVQQDVAPARVAPGRAAARARAPARGHGPHRRDVRLQPQPRPPAGDRRAHGRRRRQRGRRPGLAAPVRLRAARAGGRRRRLRRRAGGDPRGRARGRRERPSGRADARRGRPRWPTRSARARARGLSPAWCPSPATGGASPRPSASCSTTWPARPPCRSTTSACTRRSSARPSPTSSPASRTGGASRRRWRARSSASAASASPSAS